MRNEIRDVDNGSRQIFAAKVRKSWTHFNLCESFAAHSMTSNSIRIRFRVKYEPGFKFKDFAM